jgi:hypothetical protein
MKVQSLNRSGLTHFDETLLSNPIHLPLRRGNSSRDDSVNDVAFPISLVCVCAYVRRAYWYIWHSGTVPAVWGIRGNVSSGSRVFLCADWLARARVLYEACGVDPQAV